MQQGARVCAPRSKAPARWLGEALQRKARAPFARPDLSGVTAVVGALCSNTRATFVLLPSRLTLFFFVSPCSCPHQDLRDQRAAPHVA